LSLEWLQQPVKSIDQTYVEHASARQEQLTKPPGSLGRLESLAIRLAGLQGRESPQMERINITVFAADHGIAAQGVSAFPQSVTLEMIRNFSVGGAAISVISNQLGASLNVINLGTVEVGEEIAGVSYFPLGHGTADFSQSPAMTEEQMAKALDIGRDVAIDAKNKSIDLFIGGDMGIANTTAATAMGCALLDLDPDDLTGPGTGLDEYGIRHKSEVIRAALVRHGHAQQPLEILRHFGGFEIAALVGAYLACGQEGIPVLVDGFITTAAALLACRLNPDLQEWLLFSHTSAEPGHQLMLRSLNAEPILHLGMRLGEGSGAGVAVPLLRMACNLHNQMATFADAGVAGKCR